MTRGMEHDLMRLMRGELSAGEARELKERMRREPELAAAYGRLEQTWNRLELPPAAPVPPGFTGRVMARVRSEKPSSSLSWAAAPGWVRAAAATALLAGAGLGIGLGRSWPGASTTETPAATSKAETVNADLSSGISSGTEDLSLAAGYWSLVDDETSGETEARP
jgi:anti-sigma factor RsiW